ncbi:nitric-oxide reductase large subunit [Pyrobaculum calidifontis]|uniref:Nitric oxide reductase, NorZ apoprotein n=1 Tax=Pyrobaculum calidifontis (strain DSM 21063 / JCM 11548 / VA1) TaxID=410359 RepID=A3MXF7_PYRCJ|nr:nitric-oxide reductase large subunit [Pyrobaculum calidifontis]ABO09324.1 nitric oxide reductase, NorZ apoprotein [Pyrobaculum calidifontis JCM 11548]
MRNGWSLLVLGVTVLVYVVYLAMAVWTFYNMPPIPDKVVTKSGAVLFTGNDVIEGKRLAQKYGLLDYGSFLGFGGYFGIDYVAYTMKIYADKIANLRGAAFEDVRRLMTPRVEAPPYAFASSPSGTFVVSDEFGKAFNDVVEFYAQYFGPRAEEVGLRPNLITNRDEVRKIAAFFTWGVLVAMANYTNGFPYMPGILSPNIHVTTSTWVTFFVLLLAIMPLAGYIIIKFLDYWREPRIALDLPPPGPAQRVALLGMALAVLGLSIQGLLGGYLMHKYTEPTSLYGIAGINSVLPFNVARALHYNLAILWIVVTWVSFALFVLPYLGVQLSKARALAILGAGAFAALGVLLGVWASYLQLIPDPWWFIFGSQGRPVVNQGTFWLLLIAALLFYLSAAVWRASKTSPEPIQPLVKILAIALGGTAFGAVVGALPVVAPWPHFTIDEYFRWILIHSFVEGFWPAIVIPILLILLVIAGMVPPKMAVAAAGLDATLEIATGMIGTAHHYYWGGQPTLWMYVGAVMSTLEVLPIGFLIAYALVLWRRGEYKTELQKTLLTFVLVAAFGGAVGVVAFGAGLINMPVINYYLHGSQATMVHAHLAMPLAYGVPSMLMWVVAFTLAGAFSAAQLKRLRVAVVVMAVGFYIQVLLSLMLLATAQFTTTTQWGYWASKAIFAPDGTPAFWMRPDVQTFVWLRMIGDIVAAAGIAVFLIYIVKGLPKALRG